ncbi:MAG: DUF1269 domain-containing protein, partial [Miltoncostaeaceae bacterium]
DYDTLMVFAGTYDSSEVAEQDYEDVKSLYYDLDLIDTFDAAVIQKDQAGKVRILKKHEQPTRKGGWRGAGWGLAAGAVLALFPAAAIGGGLLAATTGGGAAIGAIAGHVSGGMNRGDLKDLGELLDEGQSGLVVVAATDVSGRVEKAITRAQKLDQKELKAAEEEIQKDVDEAAE